MKIPATPENAEYFLGRLAATAPELALAFNSIINELRKRCSEGPRVKRLYTYTVDGVEYCTSRKVRTGDLLRDRDERIYLKIGEGHFKELSDGDVISMEGKPKLFTLATEESCALAGVAWPLSSGGA